MQAPILMDSSYIQAVITHVAQGLDNRLTDKEIAAHLRAHGLRTPTHKPWSACNVTHLLGQVRHNAEGGWGSAIRELQCRNLISNATVESLSNFRTGVKNPRVRAAAPTPAPAPQEASKAPQKGRKSKSFLVYLNADKIVGVADFDCAKKQRSAYAEACVQLVEGAGLGRLGSGKFNAVQQFAG